MQVHVTTQREETRLTLTCVSLSYLRMCQVCKHNLMYYCTTSFTKRYIHMLDTFFNNINVHSFKIYFFNQFFVLHKTLAS